MGSNTKKLFKDRIERRITQRNQAVLAQQAQELLDAIDEGEDAVKSLLFGGTDLELYADHGTYKEGMHHRCDGLEGSKVTEPRIFKCMFYRNGPYSAAQKCDMCAYENRLKLVGDYRIIDYQVPAYYYGAKIGKIDLVVSNGITKYAVEGKPDEGNDETLLRMIAEIMTYTMGYPEGTYQRAIAFFEGTAQAEEFYSKTPNGKIKEILQKADIAVFCFRRVDERTYEICRL